MDLWLSQLVLNIISDACHDNEQFIESQETIFEKIQSLITQPNENIRPVDRLADLVSILHGLQKKIDIAVNNYPFTSEIDVNILTSPGELIFLIPKIISKYFSPFRELRYLYLMDELENLLSGQQKYINTIVREKELPCSFKIGARLYGLRTLETYSAGEVNKEGSEFEFLHLDEQLRKIQSSQYKTFAKELCLRRLSERKILFSGDDSNKIKTKELDQFFDVDNKSRFLKDATSFVCDKLSKDRIYFLKLIAQLKKSSKFSNSAGHITDNNIEAIINNLSCSEYPLIEKVNIFLLYQDWSRGYDLVKSSVSISEECSLFIQDKNYKCRQKSALSHFQNDLYAQILRESSKKQRYLGMDDFINMSAGLPRNLLIILKHVFQWSVFNDEAPFSDKRMISVQSQREGVIEASDWFFRDARMVGSYGSVVQDGVSRLATLFREIRFSDKPTECSLVSFSVDLTGITDEAKKIIKVAEDVSLLINIPGGQRDRNTKRVDGKYQLNPMLSPRWDLPVHRRGTIALTNDEVNSIFDPEYRDNYDRLMKTRVMRMTAPMFGRKSQDIGKRSINQGQLPGIGSD